MSEKFKVCEGCQMPATCTRSEWCAGPAVNQCDCCGQATELTRCEAYGIETFACEKCRGA
jgi:hypothetical protein